MSEQHPENPSPQYTLDRLDTLNALPIWVKAAYQLSFYPPEGIVHLLWGDCGELLHQPDVQEQDRFFVFCWAAHQIHRFGAGPALHADIWESIQQKAMAYPEYLKSGIATSCKSVSHDRDYRDMDLRILEDHYYAESALSAIPASSAPGALA